MSYFDSPSIFLDIRKTNYHFYFAKEFIQAHQAIFQKKLFTL